MQPRRFAVLCSLSLAAAYSGILWGQSENGGQPAPVSMLTELNFNVWPKNTLDHFISNGEPVIRKTFGEDGVNALNNPTLTHAQRSTLFSLAMLGIDSRKSTYGYDEWRFQSRFEMFSEPVRNRISEIMLSYDRTGKLPAQDFYFLAERSILPPEVKLGQVSL